MHWLVSWQGWEGPWLSSLLGGFKGSQGASMGGMLGSESDSTNGSGHPLVVLR